MRLISLLNSSALWSISTLGALIWALAARRAPTRLPCAQCLGSFSTRRSGTPGIPGAAHTAAAYSCGTGHGHQCAPVDTGLQQLRRHFGGRAGFALRLRFALCTGHADASVGDIPQPL